MKDFRDLVVWQRSHQMTLDVYAITRGFPSDERFGLVSQMRRAMMSVPNNLSEGCGCSTDLSFAQFVETSLRSACEVEYQLLLSRDLKYLDTQRWDKLHEEIVSIKRMLSQLIKTLRKGDDSRTPRNTRPAGRTAPSAIRFATQADGPKRS
ncbi:MAG TPA: four helix bundle protein [Pirellulales bacterium]|jgi:four helix bundle protein|nr:four helix bundle protein [Pirellulales bacterium]